MECYRAICSPLEYKDASFNYSFFYWQFGTKLEIKPAANGTGLCICVKQPGSKVNRAEGSNRSPGSDCQGDAR